MQHGCWGDSSPTITHWWTSVEERASFALETGLFAPSGSTVHRVAICFPGRPTPAQRYLGSDTSLTLFWHDFPPGLRNMWFRSEYNPTKERAPWRRHQGCRASVVHTCRGRSTMAQHNFLVHIPRPCNIHASTERNRTGFNIQGSSSSPARRN